jgi:teichuronic acid biosynthesis glycosyltransferase TuaG
MPAYNAGKFIKQSIESVLNQTYTKWELIIIDDGSTDNTREIVSVFEKKDARIKYIYQQNGKQGKARNNGIQLSKGNLVAFIDADDLWLPQFLERQLYLITEDDVDLVFSSMVKFIEKPDKIISTVALENKTYYGANDIKAFLKDNLISIVTVLVKKGALLKAGGFKESEELQFAEDYDLWLRMLLNDGKFKSNAEVLALYRTHHMQSSKLAERKYFQVLHIILNLPFSDKLKNQRDEAISIWIRRCLTFSKNLESSGINETNSRLLL